MSLRETRQKIAEMLDRFREQLEPTVQSLYDAGVIDEPPRRQRRPGRRPVFSQNGEPPDESLNRLERGIVEVVRERRRRRQPITDDLLAGDLVDKGIYNPGSGKAYTREWVNKKRNELIERGYDVGF